MKNTALILMVGVVAWVLTGCATQHASNDAGKVRTAYTVPADETAPNTPSVWALNPAIDP